MVGVSTLLRLSIFCIIACAAARGHTVPNLTIEAVFAPSGSFRLEINLDPRLFLSDQPATLPPVPAAWYLDQSAAQRLETHAKAAVWLGANLKLHFEAQMMALDEAVAETEFVAMDGATSLPLTAETAEAHLLLRARGTVPEGSGDFALSLGKAAQVSLILLNSQEGNEDRRPQVLFPGETSRPFKLVVTAKPRTPEKAVRDGRLATELAYALGAVGVGLILIIAWALKRWLVR